MRIERIVDKAEKSLEKYLFKPVPWDFFRVKDPFEKKASVWLLLLSIFPFLWLLINMPEYFKLSIIYLMCSILAIIFIVAEYISPRKTPWGATVGFKGYGYKVSLLFGVLFSIAWVSQIFLAMRGGLEYVPPRYKFRTVWANLAFFGLLIPVIEESLFNKFMTPSLAQLGGIVPAILISTIYFPFFHFAVYQLNVQALVFVGLFRFVTAFLLVMFKSWLPGLMMHIVNNLLSVLI